MEKDGAKKINKAFKSTPTKRKITQSLMKDFSDYLLGKECGLVIKAKYFDVAQVTNNADSIPQSTTMSDESLNDKTEQAAGEWSDAAKVPGTPIEKSDEEKKTAFDQVEEKTKEIIFSDLIINKYD